MVSTWGWPFEVAMLAGVVVSAVVGLVFALPALRTRGINLAVVTLGLGLAVQAVLFGNVDYTGGDTGTSVGKVSFLGIDIDRIDHPERYTVFVLAWVVLLTVVVMNVRTGRAGRRLIAVRTNERAAASLGVGVFGAKIYGFVLSAAIVGLAGTLMAFQDRTIVYDRFSPFVSIEVVVLAVLGGIGYLLGPAASSIIAVGGIGALVTNEIGVDTNWIVLAGGLILIVQLIVAPDGMASHIAHVAERVRSRRAARAAAAAPPGEAFDALDAAAEPVAPAALEVSGITVRLGGIFPVHDVSLAVRTGEVVGLIGPNGAGKTTLIDAVTGFVRPVAGSVTFDGQDVVRRSAARRARAGISRTFQSLELFEELTVRDNILAGGDRLGLRPYLADPFWPRRERLSPAAVRAVRDLELSDVLDVAVDQLPYGQRRLVSIARALSATPSILLLDEPGAGLSDAESGELRRLIRRLAEEWGLGILLVEHDLGLILSVCDRVVALDSGRRIGVGTPAEIVHDDLVRAAYLGDHPVDAGHDAGDDAPVHEGATT